jgi:hypothetical protein
MTLNASGNLSLGNTNDTYKLDVSGTGRFSGATYLATGGGNAGVGVTTILTPNSRTHTFQIGSNDSGISSELVLGHQGDGFSIFTSGGSGAGALTIAQGTTAMLGFSITGAATFSSSVTAGGSITTNSGGVIIGTGSGSNWQVYKDPSTSFLGMYLSGASPFMVINSSGNVGIGTTSPGATYNELLQLSKSDVGRINVTHTNTTGSRQSDILFTEGTALQFQIGTILGNPGFDDQNWVRGTANIPLIFHTNSAERMRIKADGIINLSNVPSSSAGLSSGDVYKTVAGVLMIV